MCLKISKAPPSCRSKLYSQSHGSTFLVPCREKDPDPEGKQLAATKDPLGEATKLVQQLKQYAGDRIKTHLLAFEVGLLLCRTMLCMYMTPRGGKGGGHKEASALLHNVLP